MFVVYALKKGERKTVYNDTWLTVAEYVEGVNATDMILTLEDNQAGSFKITIPERNQAYNFIGRYTTELIVCRVKRNTKNDSKAISEEEIFRGRVIGQTEDFMHNRTFTAEGELNYLCDTRQPQTKYLRTMVPSLYFKALLEVHNSKANKDRRFEFGRCEFDDWSEEVKDAVAQEDADNDDNKYRETSYEDTFSCFASAFEDLENPHLTITKSDGKRYINILKDSRDGGTWGSTVLTNQEIRLGSNMLDYTKSYDLSDICSVIIPLGAEIKNDEKQHIGKPVNLTLQYGKVLSDHDGKPKSLGEITTEVEEDVPKISYGLDVPYAEGSFNGYSSDVPYAEATFGGSVNAVPSASASFVDDNLSDIPSVRGQFVKTVDESFYIAGPISVTKDTKYFYTGRMWNGYGMYTFMNNANEVVQWKKSNTSENDSMATDLIEELITVPEGATKLYVAGRGDEIPLRLNRYIDDDTQIDRYVTVKEIVDTSRKKKKGTPYVKDDKLLKLYGWIEKVVEFPYVTTPQVLYNKAIKYLKEDVFENLVLEVKAIDMNNFDSTITPYSIGKSVQVISEDADLEKIFPISKMEINLAEPENSTVTLGYQTKLTVTELTASTSARITKEAKETRKSTSAVVQGAFDEAADLIKNGMNGYVTLVRDENDSNIIRELVISNTPDYKTATNVWRWNNAGLCHASSYDELKDTNVAITMDGQIVANKITSGTMYADRIRGGTLTLGGVNNSYGRLIIKDGSGNNVGYWDNDGIESTDGTRKIFIKEASIDAYYGANHTGYLDLSASYEGGQEAVIGGTHDLILEIGGGGTFYFVQINGGRHDTCGTIDGNGWHGNVEGYVSEIYINGYGPYTPNRNGRVDINDPIVAIGVSFDDAGPYYADENGIINLPMNLGNGT